MRGEEKKKKTGAGPASSPSRGVFLEKTTRLLEGGQEREKETSDARGYGRAPIANSSLSASSPESTSSHEVPTSHEDDARADKRKRKKRRRDRKKKDSPKTPHAPPGSGQQPSSSSSFLKFPLKGAVQRRPVIFIERVNEAKHLGDERKKETERTETQRDKRKAEEKEEAEQKRKSHGEAQVGEREEERARGGHAPQEQEQTKQGQDAEGLRLFRKLWTRHVLSEGTQAVSTSTHVLGHRQTDNPYGDIQADRQLHRHAYASIHTYPTDTQI